MNESIYTKGNLAKKAESSMVVKNILRAMRKRNYLYRRAKRTGVPEHMQYGTVRNNTVTMPHKAKKAFFNELDTHTRINS